MSTLPRITASSLSTLFSDLEERKTVASPKSPAETSSPSGSKLHILVPFTLEKGQGPYPSPATDLNPPDENGSGFSSLPVSPSPKPLSLSVLPQEVNSTAYLVNWIAKQTLYPESAWEALSSLDNQGRRQAKENLEILLDLLGSIPPQSK